LSAWKENFPWDQCVESANSDVFGNNGFRVHQKEAINAIMSGKDVFVSLPTGGGKSLCFQIPAICSPGVTIVISPLIALIQDQILKAQNLGIPVGFISSTMEDKEKKKAIQG
jgi:superfamily II DNA helicase RecQ